MLWLRPWRLRHVPDDVACDLVLAVEGKPLGSMVSMEPESIALLARAGCGVVLDVYCDDDEQEGELENL